jgi:hypothetical protein
MQNHNQNKIVYFTMPKIGEQEIDIQDAYCHSRDCSIVAIADGASTSLLPREWANILVEHFCDHNQDLIDSIYERWEEWLGPIQQQWRQLYLKIKTDKALPWYAKGSKDKDHGSATFVGLKLLPPNQSGEKIWEALAVGDSCLFQINANLNKIVAFPLDKSEQFKTVTNCFHSLPEYRSYNPIFMDGVYDQGDIFLLATDALAEWIIKDYENPTHRWKELISVATQEEFIGFIDQLRRDRLIKNDDTTLVRIKVVISDPEQPKPPEVDLPNPNHTNPQQIQTNQPNLHHRIWTLQIPAKICIPLICVIPFVIFALLPILNRTGINPENNPNIAQKSPLNKVSPSEKPTATGESYPNPNNSNLPEPQKVPIYSAENKNKETPIGYFFKKITPKPEPLELLVLVELSYLDTTKNKIIIPSNASSPLFTYKELGKLSPKDFLGYLIPGEYPFTDLKVSYAFNDARWVKIKVRLAK